MVVDLLYLAKNRLEFTKESFSMLVANTDWSLIGELHVCDDGSVDGTDDYLIEAIGAARGDLPEVTLFKQSNFGSPILVFNEFVKNTRSPLVCKLDNDTVVPPRFLNACVDVLDTSPELQCLGIEAFHEVDLNPHAQRGYEPCRYTGGIGVFRREPFKISLPKANEIYYGFGDWQQNVGVTCGWIRPSLSVFLLDRIPFEPWATLSHQYEMENWQRFWPSYGPERRDLWAWRFPNEGS
jgi:cellulose synthase/poly-beta-1,6-N-acetylglucosamine synthase-like glycosyltransferase